MYALMAEPELEAGAKAVAKARMKFNMVKQTFLERSQVNDCIAIDTEFRSWLGPELLLPDENDEDDEDDLPSVFAWYEETFSLLPLCIYMRTITPNFNVYHDVAVRTACEVFWANTQDVYANGNNYYTLMHITFIKRRWMSVARMVWMSAVVRGMISG